MAKYPSLGELFSSSNSKTGQRNSNSLVKYSPVFVIVFLLATFGVSPALGFFVFAAFATLFIAAAWRRRVDAGLSPKSALTWLVPAVLFGWALLVGAPVAQAGPVVPASYGGMGIFALFTPEVTGSISTGFSNFIGNLLFQLLCLVVPLVFTIVLSFKEWRLVQALNVREKK